MVDLVQHIDSVLKKYNPNKIIVACSAGLDSTVLLHACLKLDYPLEIAHVNYQLRGDDSEADQRFVQELATESNIPIHIKRIDLNESLKEGGNLQDLARQERYEFFEALRKREENTLVLLAHHREDQTETFFMNIARDSGVMGLAAMPERRGNYLRPLLSVSKEHLKEFALANQISWREDASNQSLKYTRNEWRNVILPELRRELPNLDDSVTVLTQAFQEKQSELQRKIKDVTREIIETHSLPTDTFTKLDQHEVIELCRQLGQPIGIAANWTNLNHKGTGINLQPSESFPFHKMVFDGDCYSFLQGDPVEEPEIKVEIINSLPKEFSKIEIYLDSNLISGELQLRPVQKGDRIHPIGMQGSRLVSDVVSDAKLTSIEKQKLRVLVDNEYVLWVPKLCVSRKAIASSDTQEIWKIHLD